MIIYKRSPVGEKKARGFTFRTYAGDHSPDHVHILKGGRPVGRWDIHNQRPMGHFAVTKKLRQALEELGYANKEDAGDGRSD
jgi:hypothetical protein